MCSALCCNVLTRLSFKYLLLCLTSKLLVCYMFFTWIIFVVWEAHCPNFGPRVTWLFSFFFFLLVGEGIMSTGWLIVSKQGWSKLSWVPVLSFSNDSCRQQDVIWGCRGQGRSHSFCVICGVFSATQVLCPWIQNSVGFISTLKGFLNDFSDGSWRIALTRLHCVPWWSISEMACTLTKTLQRCPKVFFLCGACKIRPLQYLNLRMLFSVYASLSLLTSMNAAYRVVIPLCWSWKNYRCVCKKLQMNY